MRRAAHAHAHLAVVDGVLVLRWQASSRRTRRGAVAGRYGTVHIKRTRAQPTTRTEARHMHNARVSAREHTHLASASAARRRGHGPRPTPRHARRSRCASQRPASFVAARCSLSPSLVNSITVLQHRDGPGYVVGDHRPHRRPQPMQTTHQHHGYASDASRQPRRPWHTRATFLRKLSAVSMPQRRQPRVAERERDAAAGLPARFWFSAERLQAPPISVDEFAKNGAVNSARARRC